MATQEELAAFDKRMAEQAVGQTPYPADYETKLAARAAENQRILHGALASPDNDVLALRATALPRLRLLVAPYKARMTALKDELRDRVLTQHGFALRNQALRDALAQTIDQEWHGPITRQIEQKSTTLRSWAVDQPIPEQARASATAVSAELRHLTPGHGHARAAEVLRDAAHSGEFGVARALIPHLKSLFERDPAYQTPETLQLIRQFEKNVQDWRKPFVETRLGQMNALQYQLDVVKTAAIENGGDIDAPGSVVNQRNGDAPALDQLVFVTTQ